ncbi:MAG TPA: hypothetical protein VFB75_17770, partial [Burkholderiales bacterium]|nr:hypothetical protein [Burkholderiales bacterium]
AGSPNYPVSVKLDRLAHPLVDVLETFELPLVIALRAMSNNVARYDARVCYPIDSGHGASS